VSRRTKADSVDVSKGLFMDLAFLLIGALVLVVSESDRQQADVYEIASQRVRSVVVQPGRLVESDRIEGESLYLLVDKSGRLAEITQDKTKVPLELSRLPARVDEMSGVGTVALVLVPDSDTPYKVVAEVRDVLEDLKKAGKVSSVYELVRRQKW
jgi:hypothetical protein